MTSPVPKLKTYRKAVASKMVFSTYQILELNGHKIIRVLKVTLFRSVIIW